ncbi:hypothetical protein PSH87_25135 [Pseudomonas sp. FP453]|uniref:hypothetical protein n=1 Tax=Pseudomonas sp. FP453 TaxID=2954094 RepID=UPI00273775D6|nr:hypothetical protein [Pseudomonas sp. FP453]WLH89812.1 hypothetical protein PSH87_25135 [Pseudomonas sp. FP453]
MVFEAPRLFFWRHLEGLSVEKRDLYINARKVGSFTQVGEKELGEFFFTDRPSVGGCAPSLGR